MEVWGDEGEEEEPHTPKLRASRQLHQETELFLQELPDKERRAKISWLNGRGAYEFERENNIIRNKYLMDRLFEGKTVTELLFDPTPVAPLSAPPTLTEHSPTPPAPSQDVPILNNTSKLSSALPTYSDGPTSDTSYTAPPLPSVVSQSAQHSTSAYP